MGVIAALYRTATDIIPTAKGLVLRFLGGTSGYVGVKAPATPTTWTMTLPSAAPGTNGHVLTGNTDGTTSWTAAAGGSSAWETSSGQFSIKAASITAGDQVYIKSEETTAANAIGTKLDSTNDLRATGDVDRALFSLYSAGVGVAHAQGWDWTTVGGYGGFALRFALIDTSITPSTTGTGIIGGYGDGTTTNLVFGRLSANDYPAIDNCSFGIGMAGQSANGYVKALNWGIDHGRRLGLAGSDRTTAPTTYFEKTAATNGELRGVYNDVEFLNVADRVQTTDNTATTIWDETLGDNSVHVIEALVVGRRTDSAGRWSGMRRVTVYRAGGGATLDGSVETIGTDVATNITPTVTFDASSNDVRCRVTGEVGKTVQWRVFIRKVHSA